MNEDSPDPVPGDREREVSNVFIPIVIFAFSILLGWQFLTLR
jgi:hypothetical protein